MKTLEAGALVFWLCLSLAGVFPQSPASRFALIPVFGPDSGGFIGLSLVNTAASKNDLIVTWVISRAAPSRIQTNCLPYRPTSRSNYSTGTAVWPALLERQVCPLLRGLSA